MKATDLWMKPIAALVLAIFFFMISTVQTTTVFVYLIILFICLEVYEISDRKKRSAQGVYLKISDWAIHSLVYAIVFAIALYIIEQGSIFVFLPLTALWAILSFITYPPTIDKIRIWIEEQEKKKRENNI